MKTLTNFFICLFASGLSILPGKSFATVYTIDIPLSGSQEVPPNPSTALGALTGTYDDATNTLSFNLSFTGLSAPTTAAHIHGPAPAGVNAGIQIGFSGFPAGVTSGFYSNSYVLTAAQETDLLSGLWYVNVHTTSSPGGEIRGQFKEGSSSVISITLSGSQEVPPNVSTGLGMLTGTYTDATNTLNINLSFTGLTGPTTAAHLHGPAVPGVNAGIQIGFTGFPAGVTSGSYANSYVLTAAQETDLLAGLWYVNVHSTLFPGGEIRGQIKEGTLPSTPPAVCNISLTGIVTGTSCNGGSNGSINVSSSNTFGTASYQWNNGNTNEDRSGLSAGTYTVTVDYGDGCTASQTFGVTQPASLAINGTSANLACRGINTGSITLAPSGGTAPYSFLWNNGSTAQNRSGLSPGTYTVTVNDANLCGPVSQTFTVTQPATTLIINSNKTNIRCYGLLSGVAGVSPSGGVSPYTYSWNTFPVKTTSSVTGLAAGVYTATVTDANGCTKTLIITITQPAEIIVVKSHTNVSVFGGSDGTASVSVSGGTPGYTYSWNTIPVKTTAAVTGLTAGTYKCTISDIKGCTKKVFFTITQPPPRYGSPAGYHEPVILTSPNPSNGIFTLILSGISVNEKISIRLMDVSGRVVYEKNDYWISGEERLFDFSYLAKGVYYLNCMLKDKNSIQKIVIQ